MNPKEDPQPSLFPSKAELATINEEVVKDSFAFPTLDIMHSILPLFSGHIFKRPTEEDWVNEVIEIKTKQNWDPSIDDIVDNYEILAVVKETPIIRGKSDLSHSPILRLINESYALAQQVRDTFGPKGLRHVLAILVALDENQRRGYCEWDVNQHLHRLGYKKKKNGDYPTEVREMAHKIVELIDGLEVICIRKDDRNQEKIKIKLFHKGSHEQLTDITTNIVKKDKMYLLADPIWYNHAFESRKYTQILKRLVHENYISHALTIYLTCWLSLHWRIDKRDYYQISIEKLFAWCNLDMHDFHHNRFRSLKKLEAELDYMREQQYLGSWYNSGEAPYPSLCKNPWDCVLTFYPPSWLKQVNDNIKQSRDQYLKVKQIAAANQLSNEQFCRLFQQLKLSIREFSEKTGLSAGLISGMLNNKKKVTKRTTERLKSIFPDLFRSGI